MLSALVAITLAAAPAATGDDAARAVTALADEYVRDYVATFPESAAFAGMKDAPSDRFTDNSPAALRAWQAKEDRWAEAIAKVDGNALWGRPEWVTYGFLREAVEASRGLRVCRQELWPVSQMAGWQTAVVQLLGIQPLGTPERRAAALARWRSLPRYLEAEVANLREGVRLGYTTPRHNVELVIEQLDGLLAAPFEKSPFHSPLERDTDAAFAREWEAAVKDEILPAIARYRDYLKNEYLKAARQAFAVTANPDGLACYQASFRAYTTLDRSPQDTYALGEREVAKNEASAAEIGRAAFGTADLAKLRELAQDDPKNHFASRDEVLAFSKDAVARARAALPRFFGVLPKAEVVVEPTPAFLEAATSSQYEPAAEDGSRPGTYRINLYKPEEQLRSRAEATAFHEAYPGHHLQIALAQERPAAHPITRLVYNSGFVEGWGRYAEGLAEEMGVYTSDHARISRRMWPAHGMVVDPGLHVMGWTRERAVEYVFATGRMTRHDAESLVDRVAVLPGQLTAYDTGAIEIAALRAQAERELGPAFDIRAFHDRLLRNGSVTLPMLREVIARWIAERKAAAR